MFCKSGILIFVFAENNHLVRQYVYMPMPCWLKNLCFIRALVPVSFFLSIRSFCLSLSLYFWLIPWIGEARWAHFLAQASKTLWRRRSSASPKNRALLAFRVTQGTSASFSLTLRASRFRSIKGPTSAISLSLSLTFLSLTPDHQVPVHSFLLKPSKIWPSLGL